jgi:hypothetical protein
VPRAGKEVAFEVAAARPAPPDAPTSVRVGKLEAIDGATYLFYERDRQPARLRFAATRRISHDNRALGCVLGCGGGAILGALVGTAAGSGLGCDGRSECPFNSEGARQLGVFGGLIVGAHADVADRGADDTDAAAYVGELGFARCGGGAVGDRLDELRTAIVRFAIDRVAPQAQPWCRLGPGQRVSTPWPARAAALRPSWSTARGSAAIFPDHKPIEPALALQ